MKKNMLKLPEERKDLQAIATLWIQEKGEVTLAEKLKRATRDSH